MSQLTPSLSGSLLLVWASAIIAMVVGCHPEHKGEGSRRRGNELRGTISLNKHRGILFAFAFSPDGKTLACSNGRSVNENINRITLWDIATGKELAALRLANQSYSLAFSPDGKMLAATEGDACVRFWESGTWKDRGIWRFPEGSASRLSFSPDGRCLASGGDKLVIVRDLATERQLLVLKHGLYALEVVTFSPDGKNLITAGSHGPLTFWDRLTGEALWWTESHKNPRSGVSSINALAFSPDGRSFATGGSDHIVRVWEVATRRERIALGDNKEEISSISYSPDGKLLAGGSGRDQEPAGDVQFWEVATGRHVGGRRTRSNGVMCLQFSPDDKKLAVGRGGNPNGYVDLWDVKEILEENGENWSP
jgi:WD40 repeat protein